MTSLDDSIISQQNMMLLDNVTNYQKAAIDYFHCPLTNSLNGDNKDNNNNLEKLSLSWSLLLKMRKHKLLRLPSCSIEDDIDYTMYLQRLHHCLWRRWSQESFHLNNLKMNPLNINWNKETDVTVLYGPDLSLSLNNNNNQTDNIDSSLNKNLENLIISNKSTSISNNDDMNSIHSQDSTLYASSVDSSTSSIFDSHKQQSQSQSQSIPNSVLKTHSNNNTSHIKEKKSLKFNDIVKRRDISVIGEFRESYIQINDKLFFNNHHHLRRSRRHKSRNVTSSYYTYNVDFDSCAIQDDEDNEPHYNTQNNSNSNDFDDDDDDNDKFQDCNDDFMFLN